LISNLDYLCPRESSREKIEPTHSQLTTNKQRKGLPILVVLQPFDCFVGRNQDVDGLAVIRMNIRANCVNMPANKHAISSSPFVERAAKEPLSSLVHNCNF